MTRMDAAEVNVGIPSIEPEDFDWIVSEHQKQIYRIVLFMVRDADTAEILTQECFLRAFRNRGSFRGESSPATWLIRIAINLAQDHNRNRRWAFWRKLTRTDRIEAMAVLDAHRSPEQSMIDRESLGAIQAAVEKLPPRQKTVFLLRFIEDMTPEAIAKAMDLEIGTVKTHLFRAVKTIRSVCMKRST
jgi:RNA polymerase sigma-70 factor (ECF subfamily)